MNRTILLLLLLTISVDLSAQSNTTQTLHDSNKEALALFFYKNTLRMINQTESKEFDELIKGIEKMKFLMIPKDASFGSPQFKKLSADYKKEGYEEIMSGRMEGRNFDVYLKEERGKTAGTIVLVNDIENLFVLDILGSIPLANVPALFKQIDESSDIGQQIKKFTNKVEKEMDDSDDGDKH
jgi:Domain of unknown function (DUF4252)